MKTVKVDGIVVRCCESRDHELRVAEVLLYWVTGPIDYCKPCAAHMARIADALGVFVKTEPIPSPWPARRRAVSVGGEHG